MFIETINNYNETINNYKFTNGYNYKSVLYLHFSTYYFCYLIYEK